MGAATLRFTLAFETTDDGEVLAHLLELPGVVVCAATRGEARAAARAAVYAWLAEVNHSALKGRSLQELPPVTGRVDQTENSPRR